MKEGTKEIEEINESSKGRDCELQQNFAFEEL